jgi:hypothetical protein
MPRNPLFKIRAHMQDVPRHFLPWPFHRKAEGLYAALVKKNRDSRSLSVDWEIQDWHG